MSNAQRVIEIVLLSCHTVLCTMLLPRLWLLISTAVFVLCQYFALDELPTASHICLRRSAGMHSCILTTNSNKLNSIICPYFESLPLEYCVYIWGVQLYKAAKQIVYWIWHTDTHSVCWLLIWPCNDWEEVQARELLVSYLYLLMWTVWKRIFPSEQQSGLDS